MRRAFSPVIWFSMAARVPARERQRDEPQRHAIARRAELLRRAKRLSALCREHHAAAIINDRPDIALLVIDRSDSARSPTTPSNRASPAPTQ